MSDRYEGFIIHLDKPIKDEYAQEIITALRMVKCVRKVDPLVSTLNDAIAYERGKSEMLQKFSEFIMKQFQNEIKGQI